MADNDLTQDLQDQVKAAYESGTALAIVGGGTKQTWLGEYAGQAIHTAGHRGIVSYAPTELVITARAGAPLAEIHAALAEHDQTLAFEPPSYGSATTLGGVIACNHSGPRRPFAGAARDFVLGVRMINGTGEVLRFGGEVMKNVAGYDISRAMAGSFGTLGIMLDVSLKVLPRPPAQVTVAREQRAADAVQLMNRWAGESYPISAAAYDGERVLIRLEGAESAVRAAQKQLGGENVSDATVLWQSLGNQSHGFFSGSGALWRISVPPATLPLALPGKWLYDWCGGLRWYRGDARADEIRAAATTAGGHAICYRGCAGASRFQPLHPLMLQLHKRIKAAFDPKNIFNRGLMYQEL